jgi:hypothetical protein
MIAALAVSGGQASAQYYGYASPQGQMPSGQGGNACYPERHGCQVVVCPPPCQPTASGQASAASQAVLGQVPPVQPLPSCHGIPPIVNELPPQPPVTVDIWRNHYVPIRIQNVPTQAVPVNIRVRWREIHVLCDEHGNPIPSAQVSAIMKKLEAQLADAAAAKGEASAAKTGEAETAVATSEPAPATPTPASAASRTIDAQAIARADGMTKRWVFLRSQGVYGFGYQRPDGLWVIDKDSKRNSPPEEGASPTVATAPATSAGT